MLLLVEIIFVILSLHSFAAHSLGTILNTDHSVPVSRTADGPATSLRQRSTRVSLLLVARFAPARDCVRAAKRVVIACTFLSLLARSFEYTILVLAVTRFYFSEFTSFCNISYSALSVCWRSLVCRFFVAVGRAYLDNCLTLELINLGIDKYWEYTYIILSYKIILLVYLYFCYLHNMNSSYRLFFSVLCGVRGVDFKYYFSMVHLLYLQLKSPNIVSLQCLFCMQNGE